MNHKSKRFCHYDIMGTGDTTSSSSSHSSCSCTPDKGISNDFYTFKMEYTRRLAKFELHKLGNFESLLRIAFQSMTTTVEHYCIEDDMENKSSRLLLNAMYMNVFGDKKVILLCPTYLNMMQFKTVARATAQSLGWDLKGDDLLPILVPGHEIPKADVIFMYTNDFTTDIPEEATIGNRKVVQFFPESERPALHPDYQPRIVYDCD